MIKSFFAFMLIVGLLLGVAHFSTNSIERCNVSLLTKDDTAETIKSKCGKPDHINFDDRYQQWVYGGFFSFHRTFIYISAGNKHFDGAQWTK